MLCFKSGKEASKKKCAVKSLLNKGAGSTRGVLRIFLHFIDFEYSWLWKISLKAGVNMKSPEVV